MIRWEVIGLPVHADPRPSHGPGWEPFAVTDPGLVTVWWRRETDVADLHTKLPSAMEGK